MLKERLTEYYGEPNKAQSDYISKRDLGYTQEDTDKLYEYIVGSCPLNFGFPDISKLADAFKKFPPSNIPKKYVCNVCLKCKTKYHYSMMFCPTCWNHGERVSAHSVMLKDEVISDVVRYNMEQISNIEGLNLNNCYDCKAENKNRCKHFGLPFWHCKEFHDCECSRCCVIIKKEREKDEQYKGEVNVPIPVPVY